jgi:DNA-binding NarL/FixJ family response regulator
MTARVVLADDAPDMREMLRLALEMTGEFAVVAEAADGEAAVQSAQEQKPDVVLLDLSMPLLDGLDAIPAIRSAAPSCRILVLSGYSDATLRRAALGRGADAFVVKGAAPREVVAAVRALLAGSGTPPGSIRP